MSPKKAHDDILGDDMLPNIETHRNNNEQGTPVKTTNNQLGSSSL